VLGKGRGGWRASGKGKGGDRVRSGEVRPKPLIIDSTVSRQIRS